MVQIALLIIQATLLMNDELSLINPSGDLGVTNA